MTYKLDLKDRKILYELDLNSRISYGQLARKVGLSKNAVSYRIQQLKKENIIKKFRAVIDAGNLGFFVFRLYINLCNTTPEKENEIVAFLRSKPIVTWISSMDGKYNLAAYIMTKDVIEMEKLWEELLEKYINYFDERLLTLITRSNYFSKAYLINAKKSNFEIALMSQTKKMQIDEKDEHIIRIMSHDSRTPIIDIAKEVKLNPKTVIARIKNLEKKKVIVGYKTVFDLQKLGYETFKVSFVLFSVTKEKQKRFLQYSKDNPNIIYHEFVLGGDDFEIELQVKNMDELRNIVEEIRTKFSDMIHDYKILHLYNQHKSIFYPSII